MTQTPTHRLAVFIGRFQPVHDGHVAVLEDLAGRVDSALVLVGSSYRARSWKNPFTYDERKAFLAEATADLDLPVRVLPLVDTLYDDRAWAANVRTAVKIHMTRAGLDPHTTEVVLAGFDKDKSTRYLAWFPEWTAEPTDPVRRGGAMLNATDFRSAVFLEETDTSDLAGRFGAANAARVRRWAHENPEAVSRIREEGVFIRDYQARTAAAEAAFGYPIPVNTADAVVVQSGHILMVERAALPGRGLWALPGGHLGRDETALDAAIRELYEECRLDMPKGAMRSRLRDRRVFDHPERSERGWVRTEAFLFELQDRAELERVRASSDAADAFWVPITELTPERMFEDHWDIVQTLVHGVPFAYTSILMAQAD